MLSCGRGIFTNAGTHLSERADSGGLKSDPSVPSAKAYDSLSVVVCNRSRWSVIVANITLSRIPYNESEDAVINYYT